MATLPKTMKEPPDTHVKPLEEDFPDGGWQASLVVLAFFMSTASSWGLTNSFGIFQTYYVSGPLSEYSPSAIAWIGSIQTFLIFLPGFLVGRLTDAGYIRSLNLFGTAALFIGLMTTSVSTEYYQFFLAQGLCFGLGLCALFLTAVSIIPHWFKRHRAFAMGIGACGSSVGGVIYPITLTRLIPRIGFPWAVRTVAFMMLFCQIISIIFLRPRLPARSLKGAAFFDWPSFKDPIYLLLCLGFSLGFMGLYTPFFYVQDFAIEHHLPENVSLYVLPIINAASTFGRILPNLLADKVGCLNMMIPCVSLSGIMILIWPACTGVPSLIIFCIIFGFVSGAFVSLPPAVVAGVTRDPKKTGIRVGQSFTVVSLALLIGPPISGAIVKASSGNFLGTAIFAGLVVLSGGIILSIAKLLWSKQIMTKI